MMEHKPEQLIPTVHSFPTLPAEQGRPLSICIITFEAIGFWLNGGIATVSTGLAELLADAGHCVTLALTRSDELTPASFEAAAARYRKRGIEVVSLSRSRVAPLEGPLEGFTAWERYAAYDWLRTRNFDIVHTSEHLGEAYYCIAAKKMGLAFAQTQFWVGCHGPSAWVIEANEDLARDAFWIWTDAAERFVLREADLVWTPSNYLLAWMLSRGFNFPNNRIFKQTYFIPDDLGRIRDRECSDTVSTRELIFFGRLELRKGVKLFIATVLAMKDRLNDVTITFMGRQSIIDGTPAGDYIACQLAGSGLSWQICDDFDRGAAYDYVVGPGRVAVLASPVDNSPCAIYELLEIGAHFIACAGGGIPELIDPSCHHRVLFAYTVESLSSRIAGLIDEAPTRPLAPLSLDRAATKATWTAAHSVIYEEIKAHSAPAQNSRGSAITLALIFDGDMTALEASVEAARWLGALVADLVLIVSDRRNVLPAQACLGVKRLSLDELSQAELLAALGRDNRAVMFLRSGALLTPEGCKRLLDSIRSVDAVVPFAFRYESDGARITEPVLAGDWAYTALYGAAPVGAILSPAGIDALKAEREPHGTNPLIWIDVAGLAGLSVLTLAEPLIDATAVDRSMHAQADMRARQIACGVLLSPGQRVMMETGCSALLRVGANAPALLQPSAPESKQPTIPEDYHPAVAEVPQERTLEKRGLRKELPGRVASGDEAAVNGFLHRLRRWAVGQESQ